MCQARVYRRQESCEQLIMEDVALIEIDGNVCTMVTLLGEEKRVQGRIVRIDLLKHSCLEFADVLSSVCSMQSLPRLLHGSLLGQLPACSSS